MRESQIYVKTFLFILLGIIEAIWGLGQLYGVVLSHHSQYLLTGSFYNPGPYSGFFATIFPIACPIGSIPYYLFAKLYAEPEFYHPDKCREMIDKVLRWNPKVPSEAIEEMKLEMDNLKEKL